MPHIPRLLEAGFAHHAPEPVLARTKTSGNAVRHNAIHPPIVGSGLCPPCIGADSCPDKNIGECSPAQCRASPDYWKRALPTMHRIRFTPDQKYRGMQFGTMPHIPRLLEAGSAHHAPDPVHSRSKISGNAVWHNATHPPIIGSGLCPLAEKERFELSRRFKPAYTLSRGASSAS